MVESICSNLEEKLDNLIEKNVIITQDGFLQSKYFIKKTKCFIKYEVLIISDEENKNYLKINLNQIYKIESNENKIKFYLDNDLIVSINIKR